MRSCGIDISSTSYGAMALAVDGEPVRALLWTPQDQKDSDAVKIVSFFDFVVRGMAIFKPDVVAVEEQAGFIKNHNVIRSLSKREGVALLAAKRRRGTVVLNPPVSQARGIVFGKGNISKDDAWEAIKKMYPDFPFRRKTVGGTDQADALVHALAAPVILERRKR